MCRPPIRTVISVLCVLGSIHIAEAKFDPPRITYVITPADAGTRTDELGERTFYINKGLESSISKGNILNVYREKRPARNMPPIRLFIGTMTITTAQHGSSMGEFTPNAASIAKPIIKYKSAMKSDIVMPRLVIDSSVLFDAGQISLTRDAKTEFEKVAGFVQLFSPPKLVIEGHTDSDGDRDSKQKLTVRQAETNRRFLIQEYDFITSVMIEARGYGEERPIVPNNSAANKALNRRIELIVWD